MKKLLGIVVLGLLLAQFQHQTIKADDGLGQEDLLKLKAQIYGCWGLPLGLPMDEDLVVRLKLTLKPDGNVLESEILDDPPWKGFYKVLMESLLHAIRNCQPLIVPTTGYEKWKVLQLNLDARKVIERWKEEAQKEAEKKAQAEQAEEAYNNSPEVQLHKAYVYYMLIKDFYESRKGYVIQYLTSDQMLDARSKIKEIQDTIVKENKIDENEIWNKAEKYYVAEWGSTIDSIKASGKYTENLADRAKHHLIYLSNIHKKVTGGTKIEKDF